MLPSDVMQAAAAYTLLALALSMWMCGAWYDTLETIYPQTRP